MQSPNHWSSEGVVHEYGEHARHMLHAQGCFALQLGPLQMKLSPLYSIAGDEHSKKAHDASISVELQTWSINKSWC